MSFNGEDPLFSMIAQEVLGEFREEKGIVTFKSGCTYQGQWVYHDRDGSGVQTFPNGSIY